MGQHHIPGLLEIDDSSGDGLSNTVVDLINDAGAKAGDVFEHALFNIDEGSGGTLVIQYQVDMPSQIGGSGLISLNNSGASADIFPGFVNSTLAGAIIPGNDTFGSYVKPIIVPGMAIRLNWSAAAVDSVSKMWVQTSRPFGAPSGGSMWTKFRTVLAFNGTIDQAGETVTLESLGISPGDVILYVLTDITLGSATNWTLTLQVPEPGSATFRDVGVHTSSGATVNPFPAISTNQSNRAWIPGNTSVGVVPIVVIPGMRFQLSSTGDDLSDGEVGLVVATPFD